MMAQAKLPKTPSRVVPSGRVYRQLFDAQMQLHRSLSNVQPRVLPAIGKEASVLRGQSAPVGTCGFKAEKTQDLTDAGQVARKSNIWPGSYPVEPGDKDPEYKAYYLHSAGAEAVTAIEEVRALPDVVEPAKKGSDIIERIEARRKERHETAVEDMKQELSLISTELEPKILELCEATKQKLTTDDEAISLTMAKIEKDEDLMQYSLEELIKLWEGVQTHTPRRQQWISDQDAELHELETARLEKIIKVFKTYSKMLEKIAFLMAPDLHRFLDKESQMINQTLLSNRRAYADLYMRMMSADIEREKAQHTAWRRRVEDWKTLNVNLAVRKFTEYMNSAEVLNPPQVEQVLEFMIAEEDILNQRRLDLVESLQNLTPPASTKTAIYKWHEELQEASKELSLLLELHMKKLHAEYEKVCQTCLGEIEKHKDALIASGAASPKKAQDIVAAKMLPLLGERQRVFEGNLETMERGMEEHTKRMSEELKSLFKFAQGAAHVWDLHEIGLAKRERELQEKLEASRHQHDNVNQEKEATLDLIMDKMRQESTENGLRDAMNKVRDMLNHIKNTYLEFHQAQVDIVGSYPDMVQDELDAYDDSVCTFFSVNRKHPDDAAKEAAEKEAEKAAAQLELQAEAAALSARSRTPRRTPRPEKDLGEATPEEKEEEGEAPLPMAVAEVLQTGKGTTFYVLTVAGEHGPPPEGEEGEKKEEGEEERKKEADGDNLFLTEVEVKTENAIPEYIHSIDIPASLLSSVKKAIRMNFLNHLETWTAQAADRSQCVVVAKTEELNNELDLRLHLHEPRSRRAELDVHNVRAAELVLHSERVSRHVKGMQRALTDLSRRFRAMNGEHNTWAAKFKQDIESLEVVFINATKSAKLVALQNQITVELDKFMANIRTSLREFRQHLDSSLQTLRDSNARFMKSFKLFSDGGNFSPEEIDEFRKDLEKLSKKIDQSEGSIMSELEGMESKRLENATNVAQEFENRFKGHMVDLQFMEKMARLMTNSQVRIKAEVADSNSQSQRLVGALDLLQSRIDACQHPNLDKEDITPTELNDSLRSIFEKFHARSHYLNCLKSEKPGSVCTAPAAGHPPRSPSSQITSAKASGAPSRVGFSDEPPKAGKQENGGGTAKNGQKKQKAKGQGKRFGSEADFDGDTSQQGGASQGSEPRPPKSPFSERSGRRETASQIFPEKRTASGLRRGSKPATKFERRFLVFGEKEEEGEEEHFLGRIQRILRETLEGLLTRAEAYYRQKGNRAVTRPQVLQETFEQCAEVFANKLQLYFQQADDYHNLCLQEFRDQLMRLEKLLEGVPPLVVQEIVKTYVVQADTARREMEADFQQKLAQLESSKTECDSKLRPTMGHPANSEQLEALCEQEKKRQADFKVLLEEHKKALQASAVKFAEEYMARLLKSAEQQLLQYDHLLTVDEVQRGRVEAKLYPTSELIRRKNAGKPLSDPEDVEFLPRGPGNWPGLPSKQMVLEKKAEKVQLTPAVATSKTTLGHQATLKARDKGYEDYKSHFEQTLLNMAEDDAKQLNTEQRWVDYWNKSIRRVKELYQ